MRKILFFVPGAICFASVKSFAYDALITSTTFDGVKADVSTTAIAIIGMFITIAAVGIIIRGMMGR